jgi:ABC-type transporter Mla subunit MlaD
MNLSVEARARWAFAGLLLAGAVIAAAWYYAASAREAAYRIRTSDPVSGLIPDAPVEFHGVEVGKVRRVALAGPRSVDIVLDIDKAVPVTQGTVATITSRGLATRGFAGYVYVALEDDGSDPRPPAAQGPDRIPVIRSAPSRSVNLDTTISQVNRNVQQLSELLIRLLDERMIASLKESADGLTQLTRLLAANGDRLGKVLADAERASARLEPLLASSQELVQALQGQVLPEVAQILPQIAQVMPQVAQVMPQVAQVLPEMRETLAGLDRARGRLEPLLESSQDAVTMLQTQLLPEAYTTLAGFERLSTTLNGVAARIGGDPSIVLRGVAAVPPGPGEAR